MGRGMMLIKLRQLTQAGYTVAFEPGGEVLIWVSLTKDGRTVKDKTFTNSWNNGEMWMLLDDLDRKHRTENEQLPE